MQEQGGYFADEPGDTYILFRLYNICKNYLGFGPENIVSDTSELLSLQKDVLELSSLDVSVKSKLHTILRMRSTYMCFTLLSQK